MELNGTPSSVREFEKTGGEGEKGVFERWERGMTIWMGKKTKGKNY